MVVTPWVIVLARKIGAIDHPDARKAHSSPTPRLGGVAIAAGFAVGMAVLLTMDPSMARTWVAGAQGLAFALALGGMLILGVMDDIKSMGPGRKFLVQLFLATVVYVAGFRISFVTSPFGEGTIAVGVFDYLLTILWVVGITNAVNLIDGLDGLASGVSVIATLTIVPIAFLNNDPTTALVGGVLAAAIIGFLPYNFNPARIFMGDSGSLLLGFALALLSVQSSTKSSTAFSIIVPVLALGLPIMDTLLAMLRRFIAHLRPGNSSGGLVKAVATPDKSHIHHRLLSLGLTQRGTVWVLYGVSFVLGAGAFAVTVSNNLVSSGVLVVVALATFIGVRQLQYSEMAVLKNGTLLPLYDWHIINSDSFKIFLDIIFVLVAFVVAQMVSHPGVEFLLTQEQLVLTLTMVVGTQLAVFWGLNLYSGSLREAGIAETLKIVRAVFLAVGVSAALLNLFPQGSIQVGVTEILLNFYFLLTLVLGSRLSFQVLKHYSDRAPRGGKKVLIYGVGRDGLYVLQRILDEDKEVMPVGFLDDNPWHEGKRFHGFLVFGGHWKLARLARLQKVDEVVVADQNIRPEVLRRLKEQALDLRIPVRTFALRVEPAPGEADQHAKPAVRQPDLVARHVRGSAGLRS